MRQLWGFRFRRTTLWLIGCTAILAGIGWAHFERAPVGNWMVLLAVLSVWFGRRRSLLSACLVCLICFAFGWWRGSLYMQKLDSYQALYMQKVTLTARAIDDGVYGTNSQMSFEANQVRLSNGQGLAGKIQLSGFGMNAVFQGDEVQASGKMYSAYGAYQGRISFAQLQLIAHHDTVVAEVRRHFTAGMQSALPEPLAPFAMGLLVGQRATLPKDTKQDLLMVGLTHIIAVSGYNLTIMLHASRKLLARRSKRLNTALSLGLMAVFLLIAGASASIVRAAIVSMLSIATLYYGRYMKPLNLIMMAAALTAWVNPFYIWSDTSWYLSFLAFFGVMLLAPLLANRLRPSWRNSLIAMVALESLCAELLTMPFVLWTFGQMSFIGLPANVMVVTLVPLAMLLSLAAGLSGMLVGPIAGWLSWPASMLLTYMLDIAHLLARVPHIFAQHIGLTMLQMVVLYGILAAICLLLKTKTKLQLTDIITDKKSVSRRGVALERSQQMVNN